MMSPVGDSTSTSLTSSAFWITLFHPLSGGAGVARRPKGPGRGGRVADDAVKDLLEDAVLVLQAVDPRVVREREHHVGERRRLQRLLVRRAEREPVSVAAPTSASTTNEPMTSGWFDESTDAGSETETVSGAEIEYESHVEGDHELLELVAGERDRRELLRHGRAGELRHPAGGGAARRRRALGGELGEHVGREIGRQRGDEGVAVRGRGRDSACACAACARSCPSRDRRPSPPSPTTAG